LARTVEACIAARIATGEVVHLDATLIRADVSWAAVVDTHTSAVLTEAGELGALPAPAEEVSAGAAKVGRVCRTDPEASLGKGARTSRVEPAYKQHTAVDAMRGVVLDVEVTGGATHDTNAMSALDAVPLATGRPIAVAKLDAGCAIARVFADLEARGIETVVPTRDEAPPRAGVIPARRFKLDARHDRLRCPRGRHLLPNSRPNAAGLKVYRSSIGDCRPCPLWATCFSPTAQRRAVLLNKDHPALLRARRKRLAWGERERALYASHRGRVEGVHGEAKAWHGLARAVRRGLGNVKIQPT
jgi:Transposase DDE domain